ncbi:bifunctional DNA-formamidopyrimidine glycosylase/DNA-(apurinic or apyrimidinic site) lyase [Candidatus Shapirobacteria bacterium CG03_land_8_20_14_0_80_39_12]|uniref:Bifunctional DNA-formamidopyrimidine glycosylase/DNA-(Apurinic or apyrimidinic site) lyase n=1 Tax=Candidatus Shapirobacteria bacterium CG03_land_8_20_14_0_80_39_12 TaxID=1974879 RepID=A0A2M7BDD6_9BACT|nr:MAG: bifunctional DNA-formamidopyrimidine glycosylase/DNA-(apurinic or apyrimidinic site) lyase [Candidatus Shapirobacteria bacterium CG03_land_8_20_14_0_80_39_12]
MPELPEVETIRLQLDQALKGLRITGVEVLNKKSFVGEIGDIKEKRVIGVTRRAKITIIELEGGVYLAIHLKLTGQLIFLEENQKSKISKACFFEIKDQKEGPFEVGELPNKYTRVIISFDKGKLFFNDLRIFGWIRVLRDLGDLGEDKFGPEANDEKTFTLDYFKNILAKTKKPIKIVIMDQKKLAGVGNIYANEALFQAKILPTRKADSLTEEEVKKLRNSIINVLKEAIFHKGSSDRDEAYRQITGEKGTYQNYFSVYGKAGQKCPKCQGTIKRIVLGGRGTFFCPNCQK